MNANFASAARLFITFVFLAAFGAAAQVQTPTQTTPPTQAATNITVSPVYACVQRGPDSKVWQSATLLTNSEGDVSTNYQSYTEIATGLCYTNAAGQLTDAAEEVVSAANGAEAVQGRHKVQWAFDANTPGGAVTVQTPDAKQISCTVFGLAYYDLSSGSNAAIGRLQDATGVILPPNQVVYENAFSNITADLLYTYTKAGLSQDIVLRQAPPPPDAFGLSDSNTVLQVYSEFINSPEPTATAVTNGNVLDDEVLSFGAMQMGVGTSLFIDDNQAPLTTGTVGKQWIHLNGQTFLVESVPWSSISNQVGQLHPASNLNPKRASVRGFALLEQGSKGYNSGSAIKESSAMKLAKAAPGGSRVVVDWVLLSGASNVTLQGDTTYLLSGLVNVTSVLTVEGGAVMKYTTNGQINVSGTGSNIVCQTGPYRPAVFSSVYDNTVGTTISNGTPVVTTNTYLNFTLAATQPLTLRYLRFSYASTAIAATVSFMSGTSDWFKLWDCQFYECITGCSTHLNSEHITLDAYNVLFSYVTNCLVSDGSNSVLTVQAQNVTADNIAFFTFNILGANVTAVNTLFTAMTGAVPLNRTNYESSLSGAGVYQPTGAGGYYLTNTGVGKACRGAGTTSIDPGLLADLGTLTTYPPAVLPTTITTSTNLTNQVPRNTGIPDIGYHYFPIDYAANLEVSGATVTIAPGVVVCSYGNQIGFWLGNNGNIQSAGTATNPVYIVRYNTVQEQSSTNWQMTPGGWEGSVLAEGTGGWASFSFTDLSAMEQDYQAYNNGYPYPFTFQNCQLYNGQIKIWGAPDSSTNCLYQRVSQNLTETSTQTDTTTFYNNLLWNGSLTLKHSGSGTWTFRDNLFDQVLIATNSAGKYMDFCSNNGYMTNLSVTTLTNLQPSTHDVFLTGSPSYLAGPFGQYYYPLTQTNLIHCGSQSAVTAGLYDFTVMANNVMDGSNTVSIGYHYPTGGGSANPVIVTQPASQTVAPGGTAALSVAATGLAPLTYQWYLNGALISGATGSSYSPTVTAANAGNYEVIVSDALGTTVSSLATLKAAQNDFFVNYWNTSAISPINSMVRGINDQCIVYPPTANAMAQTMTNASMRGLAPGTDADTYNWKNLTSYGNRAFTNNYYLGIPTNPTTPTTLELMQEAGTNGESLIFTVNSRGEGYVSGTNWYQYPQTNADLATLASDWVRYANFIVQHYCISNQCVVPYGAAGIPDTNRDWMILTNLMTNWVAGTNATRRNLPVLLTNTAFTVLRTVKYWEIGNEVEGPMPPNIYINGTIFTSNSYRATYEAIVSAMTNAVTNVPIQVGPGFAGEFTNNGIIDTLLSNTTAPVNFVVHHPYPSDGPFLNGYFVSNNVKELAGTLQSIKHWQNDVTAWDMEQHFVTNGLAVDVPIFATEWSGDYAGEFGTSIPWSMWTMLADAETLLSMVKGQQTMAACLYEPLALSFTISGGVNYGADWPANFMRFQTNLGNVYLSSSDGDNIPAQFGVPGDGTNWMPGSTESPFRVYSTMDTNTGKISVWLLNLTNSASQTVDLHFPASISNAILWTLGNTNITPNLTNINYYGGTNFVWLSNSVTWASGNSVVLTNSPATLMAVEVGLSNVPPSAAVPTISSLPGLGQAGQAITITGNNFSTNLLQNTVYFEGVRGIVTSASKTSLTVQVPFGAGYGPVTVTVSNLTAYSTNFFNPAYYGASTGNPISLLAVRTNVFTNTMSATPFDAVSEMTYFDADGDGKGDLAFLGRPGVAAIFQNTGTGAGSFVLSNTPYSLPISDEPGGTAYGDFDGDGLLDWAVVEASDWALEIFRNESTPGKIFFGEGNMYATGRNPTDVKVIDFDGDGRPDIVVANQEDNKISVYRNLSTGPGSFTFAQKVDFPACPGAQYLAVGDFDGDGKVDIAVTGNTNSGSNVVILRNLSTPGNISFASPVAVANLDEPWGIAVGDFNGDGKLDLAINEFGLGFLHVYTNNSTVGSISFTAIPALNTGGSPQGLAVADLNGDGWLDIVDASIGTANVGWASVYQNQGFGSFVLSSNYTTGSGGTYGPRPDCVVLADIDGDGRPDMAVGNFYSTNVLVFQNTSQY